MCNRSSVETATCSQTRLDLNKIELLSSFLNMNKLDIHLYVTISHSHLKVEILNQEKGKKGDGHINPPFWSGDGFGRSYIILSAYS